MAIVATFPEAVGEAEQVQVESDAADNLRAILEIDDWASEHGFVRVRDYWLEAVERDGKRVFRGACYRRSQEELERINEACRNSTAILEGLIEKSRITQ